MHQSVGTLTIQTRRKGLVDITAPVREWVTAQGIGEGLLTLFCRHTSASLVIQENAARPSAATWRPISIDSRPKAPRTNMTTKGRTICPRI